MITRRVRASARIGAGTARRALLMVSLGAGLILPGCATKKDIRSLETTISMMQAHQDSVMRAMQQQQGQALRAMMDTVRKATAITLDTKGQTSQRLGESSSLLESVRATTGQILDAVQRQGAHLDALDTKVNAMQAQQSQPQPVQSTGSTTGSSPQQIYDAGMRALGTQSYGTARIQFKALVRQYHDDPLAPDAQFYVGETYAAEGSYDEAYAAYAAVASEWPASDRASQSLYRAGKVADDQKDYMNAKLYYNRVINLYSKSDAATQARAALKKIPK